MKKHILIIAFIALSNGIYCQVDSTKYTYCEIVGQGKLFSKKVSVAIDYGQEQKLFKADYIKNEEGKIASFNSMVDALNYMGNQGWEFVQAYVATAGDQNVYHWLLKRKKQ